MKWNHRAVAQAGYLHGAQELSMTGNALVTNAMYFPTPAEAEAWARHCGWERYEIKRAVLTPEDAAPASRVDAALLTRAAEILDEHAAELTSAHTVQGEWPDEEFETLAYVKDVEEAAKAVRQVLAGVKA